MVDKNVMLACSKIKRRLNKQMFFLSNFNFSAAASRQISFEKNARSIGFFTQNRDKLHLLCYVTHFTLRRVIEGTLSRLNNEKLDFVKTLSKIYSEKRFKYFYGTVVMLLL